jgi:hypothetical protein
LRTTNTKALKSLPPAQILNSNLHFPAVFFCQKFGLNATKAKFQENRGIVTSVMELHEAAACDLDHQPFNQPLFSVHQALLSDILLHC